MNYPDNSNVDLSSYFDPDNQINDDIQWDCNPKHEEVVRIDLSDPIKLQSFVNYFKRHTPESDALNG